MRLIADGRFCAQLKREAEVEWPSIRPGIDQMHAVARCAEDRLIMRRHRDIWVCYALYRKFDILVFECEWHDLSIRAGLQAPALV